MKKPATENENNCRLRAYFGLRPDGLLEYFGEKDQTTPKRQLRVAVDTDFSDVSVREFVRPNCCLQFHNLQKEKNGDKVCIAPCLQSARAPWKNPWSACARDAHAQHWARANFSPMSVPGLQVSAILQARNQQEKLRWRQSLLTVRRHIGSVAAARAAP